MLLLFISIIVPTTGNKIKFHLHDNASLNVQLLQKKVFETFSKHLPSSTNLETLAEQIIRARPTKMVNHNTGSGTVTLVIFLIIVFVVYHRLYIRLVNTNQTHLVRTFFYKYNKTGGIVRKHLTGGFPCAVMDLSGNLWPLLIPEYSGIEGRGTPFPGLRNPGISFLSFSLW